MQLGWIGLGNMGVPISLNLLKAGYSVTVFNRTASKASELIEAGAILAQSLEELVQSSDVIFTMVSDDEAVKDLYFSKGLLDSAKKGQVFIDMSTVAPSTSQQVYAAAKEKGIGFVDAPVSGSVAPAKEGKLLVLAGGEEETFNSVKELFEPMCKMSIYLGESGSGSNAKLAINLLLGITVQGIAESVLFAEKQGIQIEDMLTIINESAVGTAISKMKTPAILKDEYPAAFALKHMAKDLRLAKETGELNAIGNSAYHTYKDALDGELGEMDVMAVIKELRSKK
ncbi:NAD(P)-dependent oxidoreductase [Paenibacillus alvei]|uniref:NAD(P)-dependent oxidoreductase n=1 Tax=Niallia sp. FSL R7-0271 TaxID=2921678 RepID=UPI0030FA5B56